MKNPIIPFYHQADRWIVKAEGCSITDSEHKPYVDFESGDWAAFLGHSHPRISECIRQQAERLIHDGLRFRNYESEELSLKLLSRLNLGGGQSAFVNSGSEAVNLGITMARHVTGRRKILKMDCSYLSAFGYGKMADENPDLINIPMDDMDAVSTIDYSGIAVFVFEPGNALGLIRYPEARFVEAIAAQVKKHNGLLMANEVTTGFGRTGKWFGFQHYDYQPELVAVGKSLGNGYPVSGLAVSAEVADRFARSPFRYAQSHQNDPLGCAVGLAVFDILEKENLVQQAYVKGEYIRQSLVQLQEKHPAEVTGVRARGLMIGVEFQSAELAARIYSHLTNHGYLTGIREKTIRLMPPVIIEKPDVDGLINAIDRILMEKRILIDSE